MGVGSLLLKLKPKRRLGVVRAGERGEANEGARLGAERRVLVISAVSRLFLPLRVRVHERA